MDQEYIPEFPRLFDDKPLTDAKDIKEELRYLEFSEERMVKLLRAIDLKKDSVRGSESYLNSFGIYRLPESLLQHIFRFAYSADDESVWDVLVWSGVSTVFRRTVRGMPCLWSTLSNAMRKEHLLLSLFRAGEHPLRILINQDRNKVNWVSSDKYTVVQFIRMVMQYRQRWESFHYRICEQDFVGHTGGPEELFQVLARFNSPTVKEIVLEYAENTPYRLVREPSREYNTLGKTVTNISRDWQAPSLKVCRAIDMVPSLLHSRALETLELTLRHNWAKGWSFEDLCILLDNCHSLRNLSLTFDSVRSEKKFSDFGVIITLHNLENMNMSLSNVTPEVIEHFTSLFQLPSLKQFTIELHDLVPRMASESLEMGIPAFFAADGVDPLETFILKLHKGVQIDKPLLTFILANAPQIGHLIFDAPFSKFDIQSQLDDHVDFITLRECTFKNCARLTKAAAVEVEKFLNLCAGEQVDFKYVDCKIITTSL